MVSYVGLDISYQSPLARQLPHPAGLKQLDREVLLLSHRHAGPATLESARSPDGSASLFPPPRPWRAVGNPQGCGQPGASSSPSKGDFRLGRAAAARSHQVHDHRVGAHGGGVRPAQRPRQPATPMNRRRGGPVAVEVWPSQRSWGGVVGSVTADRPSEERRGKSVSVEKRTFLRQPSLARRHRPARVQKPCPKSTSHHQQRHRLLRYSRP